MSTSLRPVIAALRAGDRSHLSSPLGAGQKTIPFITISRMAGVGGRTLARRLADRLNAIPLKQRRINRDWQCFDKELLEKIAADHDISASLLEALEDEGRNWVLGIIQGMAGIDRAHSDAAVYHKVAQTVLALARLGQTIIVGRGGAFITSDMPGGIHILVVAPRIYRIEHMAHERNVSFKEAERLVDQLDESRAEFYRQHWPSRFYSPEAFTLTLNSGKLTDDQMADAVLALVK